MKKRNRGFTIMELVVAIGVLGSLTVMTAGLMDTSSNTYRQVGTESQLQSEAQLVANAISEVIIDGQKVARFADLESVVQTADADYERSYAGNEGSFLPVWIADDKIRVIARKNDELYVFDVTATPNAMGGIDYSSGTSSLLGQHIEDFKVNTTRAADHRIIDYSLTYRKVSKTYKGDYQVYMRNGGDVTTVSENEVVDEASVVSATVAPKMVFVDIYDHDLKGIYYKESVLATPSNFVGDPTIDFGATVIKPGFTLGGADELHVYNATWSLGTGSPSVVSLSGEDTENCAVQFDTTAGFDYINDLPAYQFQLDFEAEGNTYVPGTDDHGNPTKVLDRQEIRTDYATIYFRLCRKVDVSPVLGPNISAWDEARFGSAVYASGASKVNGIDDYVKPDSTITISGICDSPNVPDDKPYWKLEYRLRNESDADYRDVPSDIATLGNRTGAVESNSVKIGSSATNDMVFRITCTSSFDDTKHGKYEFGVQPAMNAGDKNGYYSRGYYTDMNQLFKDSWTKYTTAGHTLFEVQEKNDNGSKVLIDKLIYLEVEGIYSDFDGHGTKDMVKITYDADGTPRMYIDYQIFQYQQTQKNMFYKWGCQIKFYFGFKDKNGKYWCNGGDAQKTAMRAKMPADARSATIGTYEGSCTYNMGGVSVTKIQPTNGFIMLNKGDVKTVGVTTHYYNIMRPSNGNYYFGVYLGDRSKDSDMKRNLVIPGNGGVNAYFDVDMISNYGDVDKYVENGFVDLKAKSVASQSSFLTKPVTLRMAANDFYLISKDSASYTDFDVLIANLMSSDEKSTDAEVYFPVPVTDDNGNITNGFTVNGVNLTFPSTLSNNFIAISGINKNGSVVYGQVANTDRVTLKYDNKVYKYDSVHKCWKRS